MQFHVSSSALKQIRWYEYVVRFLFGGAITAAAGFFANKYGPTVGGLFLAFPAIFPAAASLVAKHEVERKHHHGMHGNERGRQAAVLEARGTSLGSIGLVAFAIAIWRLGTGPHWAVTLAIASIVWGLVAAAWKVDKKLQAPRKFRHHPAEYKRAA